MKKSDVNATKHPVNGAWVLSSIVDGVLVTRVYYEYSKKEAVSLFIQEFSTTK